MDIFWIKDSGDGVDGIDCGVGECVVYLVCVGVLGGGSKNEKSFVMGFDIVVCGVGGGSQISYLQVVCLVVFFVIICLFRQFGGYMDLVVGVCFGNVIGSVLFFCNGCDFCFCVVQGVCCYVYWMSEVSERDQGEYIGSGE